MLWYDRIVEANIIGRLHQIDFCQLLGISSADKYEVSNHGMTIRPHGVKSVLEVIDQHSDNAIADKELIAKWVVYNYLIGNTDSYLKNISLIYTDHGFRLAPFYDMTSVQFYQNNGAYLFDNCVFVQSV